MTSFTYIARTTEGTIEKGNIDAPTIEQAREILRKRNLMVEEVRTGNAPAPAMGFVNTMPWTSTDEPAKEKTRKTAPIVAMDDASYIPLLDTLRLFAGWLLAWYAVVFLLGSFQMTGRIPYDLPFLQGLFESWLVLRFAFATFVFLALTTLHRTIKGGIATGLILGLIGVVLFVLFHLNA